MKIYISHSTGFDYTKDLYGPMHQAFGNVYDIYFPHEAVAVTKSKDIIKNADIVLAEVSYPSTGQGIELGWAEDNHIPIICCYRSGTSISSALSVLKPTMVEYNSIDEMVEKIRTALANA